MINYHNNGVKLPVYYSFFYPLYPLTFNWLPVLVYDHLYWRHPQDKLALFGFFTKRQNFKFGQIETIFRWQNKYGLKIQICFGKDRKHLGKQEKCKMEKMMVTFLAPLSTTCSRGAFRVVTSSIVRRLLRMTTPSSMAASRFKYNT